MSPETAAALAGKAAQLNILYTVFALLVLAGVFGLVVSLGEKAFGLDIKGFVNNVEEQAKIGNLWPGVVSFVVVPASILGLVLYIGLR